MIPTLSQGSMGYIKPRRIDYLYIKNAEEYKNEIRKFLSYHFNTEVTFERIENGDYLFHIEQYEIYIENKECYIILDKFLQLILEKYSTDEIEPQFEICTPDEFALFYSKCNYIIDDEYYKPLI